jgi:rod shape-determining protein MreC
MAVIGAEGVIGRVINPVASHAATVQLLVDANAAAAIVFERSQTGAIAVGGQSDGTLRAEFVPVLADIEPGELVTTSGQDRVFPPGFPVGTVESISGAGTPNRTIRIRPAADFSHLDVVLVVLTPPPPLPAATEAR